MRVLHVTPYFAPAFVYGGPPRSVLGLCKALIACGVDAGVATTAANGASDFDPPSADDPCFEGVSVRYFRRAFPRGLFRSPGLSAHLRGHATEYDLLHIHGCWNFASWAGASAARHAPRPYVVSPRGMLEPWSFRHGKAKKAMIYRAIERPNLRAASALHATSDEERGNLEALDLAAPVAMIPNGVDLTEFDRLPERGALRDRLGVKGSEFVALFLGRIHPKKGLDILAHAFGSLLKSRPDSRLIVAGDGDPACLADLRARFGELERARRLIFLGPVDMEARLEAYAAADVFALASHSENFGLTIAEALACGLPVVASRGCPWPQLESWRAGFWVENNADAFAHALGLLAGDADLRHAMGENGRREVRAAFAWPPIAERMKSLYEQILSRREPAREVPR